MLRGMHELEVRLESERDAAFDILLLMADADARWRDYDGAIALLEHAEEAAGALSPEYELKRLAWKSAARA
jgi:hypothetical protein